LESCQELNANIISASTDKTTGAIPLDGPENWESQIASEILNQWDELAPFPMFKHPKWFGHHTILLTNASNHCGRGGSILSRLLTP
jgi:hypothetical protein